MYAPIYVGCVGTGRGYVTPASGHGCHPRAAGFSDPNLLVSALVIAVLLGISACSPGAGPAPPTAVAGPAHPANSASPIAWPGTAPVPAPPAAAGPRERVAPVSSMVDGLRARLEKSRDDAKGWALLAQSYAFMGNQPGAEEALARAVALGMDEQALRQRIQAAAPRPQPSGDWVQQALNR